ncbi:hypothetical protein TrLO_g12937 [Triparma laevis f. longispina]|uniref:Peptidase n=1 Tax=Triparma laevis f. longispina TaxID=1714387 RepID=A0A9W7FNY0_9STRA|nr:hypothetical protein TrLO_g12937 [Triparma laevis f. longispina]
MRFVSIILAVFAIFHSLGVDAFDPGVEKCTSIALGTDATKSGSVMISHGNDCPTCDFRTAYVPAMDHPVDSKTPIYIDYDDYPRMINLPEIHEDEDVSVSQAKIYDPEFLEPGHTITTQKEPMGFIEQVEHTFGYVDGAYGIMNEHQLAFGESTCDALLGMRSSPVSFGGSALFGIAALSRIALQRCKTARCAIELMGGLAEEKGFYGANSPAWVNGEMTPDKMGYAEGGEALTIADKTEAWIFNISPDDTGTSAVWVAQRVPDDHVSVVTNTFNIGQIDLENSDYFLASSNVFDVAEREGLYDPKADVLFDFAQIYRAPVGHQLPNTSKTSKRVGSMMRDRRRWVVFNTVAPSLKLDPYNEHTWDDSDKYLPFSVKPDHKLSEREVFRIHRDFYQDTPFDITKDAVGGPFGDPFRGSVFPDESPFNDSEEWNGTFERSVAQLWTSYTTITESREWLPDYVGARIWFGPHSAVTNAFVPIYPGAAKLSNRFPKAFEVGSLLKFNEDSFWWQVCLTANYAGRFFTGTIDMVQEAQAKLEVHLLEMTGEFEQKAIGEGEGEGLKTLERMQQDIADYSMAAWKSFFYDMVSSFHDGIFFKPGKEGSCEIDRKMGYPSWWLNFLGPKAAGLSQYHVADDSHQRAIEVEKGAIKTTTGGSVSVVGVGVVSLLVGLVAGRMLPALNRERNVYEAIPQ